MLDKQYSRVIRWINRAQSMSADGKYSDAILDVECARAELDDARQELLLCHKTGSERKKVCGLGVSILTGCCMVFFLVSPLQMPHPRDMYDHPLESQAISAENNEVIVKTASLEPTAVEPTAPPAPMPEEVVKLPEGKVLTPAPETTIEDSKDKRVVITKKIPKETHRLSERDVYRLVEVGRKALQGKNSSVVLDIN